MNAPTLSSLLILSVGMSARAQFSPELRWADSLNYGYVVTDVAVSPDGTLVACPRNAGVALRRVSNGSVLTNLALGSGWVSDISFSSDGQYLAAGASGTVRVWKVADWSLAYSVSATAPITFSPDSTLLATVLNSEIQLRSATNGLLLQSWTNPPTTPGGVVALAFSPDGTMLASGAGGRGSDTNLTIWSVPAGHRLRTVPTAQTYHVGAIAFSPDGQYATTAGGEYAYGPAQLWRVSDWKLLRTFPGGAYAAPFSPDGSALAVIGTNLNFYTVPEGAVIRQYSDSAHGSYYQKALAFTPDGASFLRVCYSEIFRAQAPFAISAFQPAGSSWHISWTGGRAPFRLQECTNLLTGAWQDIAVPTTNRALVLPARTGSALYRVLTPPE